MRTHQGETGAEAQNAARVRIASYDTYSQAQAAIDSLADRKFPVQHLAISAEGLRMLEMVTGRRGFGRAAVDGAATGAFTGAIIGFIFGLLTIVQPLTSAVILAFVGILAGAVLGAVAGAIGHAALGGRRDFSSMTSMAADRYDVVADAGVADDARRMLTAAGDPDARQD